MVDAENKDKWDDAQQVSMGLPSCPGLGEPALASDPCALCPQVSPGSVHLLRVVEDFIHLVGDALKAFQSSLIVTDNLGTKGLTSGRGGLGLDCSPLLTSTFPLLFLRMCPSPCCNILLSSLCCLGLRLSFHPSACPGWSARLGPQ